MQGKTHLLVGAVAGLALATPAAPGAIILGAMGGLLPDIDHPNGKLSRMFPPGRILTFWLKHRTWTHSLWFALLLLLPALLIDLQWLPLAVGYALHIACDAMTRDGVPLLYPLRNRFYLLPRPVRFITGGGKEGLFTVAVALAGLALLYRLVIEMTSIPLIDLVWF